MLFAIRQERDRSVALTVRRTDYVGSKYHGLLAMSYYRQAAELIATQVPEPVFFVFSDDPEWCRAHFHLPFDTIIAGNFHRTVPGALGREDAELYLMSQCRHAVLANSSYSWWGAWLGPDRARDGGIIVAPQQWFLGETNEEARDIVPARWLKL
jgi:hypothetical protein